MGLGAVALFAGGCERPEDSDGVEPDALIATAAPVEMPGEPLPVALDQAALDLILRLGAGPHRICGTGDEITEPEEIPALLRLGPQALPTIVHCVETTRDDFVRSLLIDCLGRLGDARARPLLERVLESWGGEARSEALAAVARLGCRESVPLLRRLLAADPESANPLGRMGIYLALHRCGDVGVIDEVLRELTDGVWDDLDRSEMAELLVRHPPIREALGFDPEAGTLDSYGLFGVINTRFWKAVDEWYRESVLGQASPHRSPVDPPFAEPWAAEKRAAWRALLERCETERDEFSAFRARPVDPTVTDADVSRTVACLTGSGHGNSLDVWVLRPEAWGAVCHHFAFLGPSLYRRGEPDERPITYETARLDLAQHRGLVAGLRTILEARLVPWWSGPGMGCSSSTGNFAVSLCGVGAPEASPLGWSGYPGSSERKHYLALVAARIWFEERLERGTRLAPATAGPDTWAALSDVLQQFQAPGARGGACWWVDQRLAALAAAFKDGATAADRASSAPAGG